jgi:hypothetical protein
MKYFVSRQIVWPDGTPVVEIAGCLDMAGPDMLVARWGSEGEGREFDDPREAAQAAIRVRDLWWAVGKDRSLKGWDKVEIRLQRSFIIQEVDELDDAGLLVWADQRFEKIRKCAECGDPIYDDKKAFYPEGCHGDDDFLCCREYCAEQNSARSSGVADTS